MTRIRSAAALTAALTLLAAGAAWACSDPQRSAAALQRLLARGVSAERLTLPDHAGARVRIDYRPSGAGDCRGGRVDGFACANVALLGHLDLDALGGGHGTDNWGWRDPQSGRYYALVGRSNGSAFVDVSDPAAPRYIGELPTQTVPSGWRDIKTYRHYALIVADELTGHGMQVFNLRRLRGLENAAAPRVFAADAVYHGIDDAHNIVVNEQTGFAYAVGGKSCAGGLHMIDLAEPLRPLFAGCFAADGYSHDAQCVTYRGPDPDYRGREICFASNEDSVTLVDVSDKTRPALIVRASYPDAGYTHQGWLDAGQRYFIVDDEFDEVALDSVTRTLIWDMLDLDAPRLVGVHRGGGRAVDHNQYVIGDYVYQAHYTRGLRVLKINDLAAAELTEVAYFDSHPEVDDYSSRGAWNVYPFFDNGVVLLSDINRGLFLLRPRLETAPPAPAPLFENDFETDIETDIETAPPRRR